MNVFPIRVPPLRERAEDIPLLIAHFVRRFAERQGKTDQEVPDHVIARLKQYSWPGNVRELQNVIERAVVATTGRTSQLPGPGAPRRQCGPLLAHARASRAGPHRGDLAGNERGARGWDGAAARLGLSRTTLISRMQRLGISAGSGLRKSAGKPAVSRLRSAQTAGR